MIVKNIESLKITKSKGFAVYFTIDGTSFLLHETSEAYESGAELYIKKTDSNGHYELTHIKNSYSSVYDILPSMKKGATYSQVNKYEFVYNLVRAKLIETNNDAIKLLIKMDIKRKEMNKLANKLEQMTRR